MQQILWTRMVIPDHISEIKLFLQNRNEASAPDAVIILGSGLGSFGKQLSGLRSIPYTDIPHFPNSTVAGHDGKLLFGEIDGKKIMAFSGRFHHYEGYPLARTVLPVQLAKAMNAEKLIISNAAGGINLHFRVGDLMVIDGIIRQNMILSDPSEETWNYELYPYADKARELAEKIGVVTQRGTYLYVKGPNYETKAEIRAFRKMGGDAVGMSTAPELMEAARLNVKAVAVSLITNAAAGVTDQKLDHAEVKEAAELKKDEFAKLVRVLIREL
ncbi:purine-nucleoside phosphorylase [Balneola sp. MJW-20]|uniref:purine-nucleoside phosphorylase n=1 Tax=Gracilimonas aurantiaca TaxID=3234185 RepID=UPI0034661C57